MQTDAPSRATPTPSTTGASSHGLSTMPRWIDHAVEPNTDQYPDDSRADGGDQRRQRGLHPQRPRQHPHRRAGGHQRPERAAAVHHRARGRDRGTAAGQDPRRDQPDHRDPAQVAELGLLVEQVLVAAADLLARGRPGQRRPDDLAVGVGGRRDDGDVRSA